MSISESYFTIKSCYVRSFHFFQHMRLPQKFGESNHSSRNENIMILQVDTWDCFIWIWVLGKIHFHLNMRFFKRKYPVIPWWNLFENGTYFFILHVFVNNINGSLGIFLMILIEERLIPAYTAVKYSNDARFLQKYSNLAYSKQL